MVIFIIGLIAFGGFCFFLIKTAISLFTKNNIGKNFFKFIACFAVLVLCIVSLPNVDKETEGEDAKNSSELLEPDDSTYEMEPGPEDVIVIENETEISEELTTTEKEKILKIDSAIWDRVMSAENNYNSLLDEMENSDSPYSVYEFCENIESLMNTYIGELMNIPDDRAGEYADYAGLYISQVGSIATHVKKFVNSGNMEELSKAEDGMQNIGTFATAVVTARFSYLSVAGFTDEEIAEIGTASTE